MPIALGNKAIGYKVWKSCVSTETVKKFAEASEKVFDLAETLNNQDNQKNPQIKELV